MKTSSLFRKIRSWLLEVRIYRSIRRSGLFDQEYYLYTNLDVARSCANPIWHYIRRGWKEGRNPSASFDTRRYLQTYPQARQSGINPLFHYIQYGKKGGFSTAPQISKEQTIQKEPSPMPVSALRHLAPTIHWSYRISESQLLERVREYRAQKSSRKAKVVVYTAIIGGKDNLIVPEYIVKEWDYVCFSDMEIPGEHIFEIRRPDYLDADPRRTARFLKTHPHLYFQEYVCAVWLDSSILIRGPHLETMVNRCLEQDILFMCNPHPNRDCLFEELAKCIHLMKDDHRVMKSQVKRYKREGYPKQNGMLETGILIRRHNDHRVIDLDNDWWNEISGGSCRDQLSVMYVLWKHQLPYTLMENMKNIRYHEGNDYCLFLHEGRCNTLIPPYVLPSFMKKSNSQPSASVSGFVSEDLRPLEGERIDIVVCVHNALDDVRRCLESVWAALLSSHRLFLIDDGSETATAHYLRQFAERSLDRIILIRNDKTQGYTRSANQGLKLTDAPFVILLNSDTLVPVGWSLKLLQAAKSLPGTGMVGPLSNAASWQSLPWIYDFQTGQMAVNELPPGQDLESMNRLCEIHSGYPNFPRVPLINGFCFGIWRQVLEKIGYLDEKAFPIGYGEEDDLAMRALNAGFMHVIATHCFVYHAKSKSFRKKERNQLITAGRKTLFERYGAHRINCSVQTMLKNSMIQAVRQAVNNACGLRPQSQTINQVAPVSDQDSHIILKEAISTERLSDISALKSLLSEYNIQFFEFGCSKGDGLSWTEQKTGYKGLGFDTDPQKLQIASERGLLCCNQNILDLPNIKLVSFTTLFHFLEHLESVKQAMEFILKACAVSRDYVYIRQPYFDADSWLFCMGFKTFYSHWTGHRNRMVLPDFFYILEECRNENLIRDYKLAVKMPIQDSSSPMIHSLSSVKDSLHYDPCSHPAKKTGVPFFFPVFYETVAILKIGDRQPDLLWKEWSSDATVVYDSRKGRITNLLNPEMKDISILDANPTAMVSRQTETMKVAHAMMQRPSDEIRSCGH